MRVLETEETNKINELRTELIKASELYYNGKESFLTDKEFDSKLEELRKLELESGVVYSDSPTIKVGAPILSSLNKVSISGKPMLSLGKVHSAEEVIAFNNSYDMMASVKCDGLSIRLVYEHGRLISANTRGDGYVGGDVTEHVKHFLNVPLVITKVEKYVIDGEAVIYDNDFAIINKNNEFKNSRNAAAGSLNLLDMSIVKERRLSFIAWEVIEGGKSDFYHYNMEEADDLGFTTVPGFILDCTKIEKEDIDEINEDLIGIAKENGIPCDGVVWRINDNKVYEEKGKTDHHFCGAIAWKPENEEFESELLDIEFTMGRTGVLTPVAIFKPVDILGSVVERASLHNLSVMKQLVGDEPRKGQKVWIYKANMIIPQISHSDLEARGDFILDPFDSICCPICWKPATVVKSESGVLNLVCKNPSCEGKLANRIDHYLGKKGLDVKGISKATIEKLIDWGWINGLRDIYKLSEYKTEWIAKEGFGAASVGKILNAIDASKSGVQLDAFISAIGIPLIGKAIAKQITKYYSTWEDFRNAVGGDWTQFNGFGPEMSKAINNFDYTEADSIVELLVFNQEESETKVTETASTLEGKTFVITGKLSRARDLIKADIEAHGGKVTGSVSSKTNYLVCNDKSSTTGKSADAKRLGIPVITEEELVRMF